MTPDDTSDDSSNGSTLVVIALLVGMAAYAVLSLFRNGRDAWQQML